MGRLLRHAGGYVGPILLPRTHRGPLEMCQEASIYNQNHRAEQLPNSDRYWALLTKEYLSGVI